MSVPLPGLEYAVILPFLPPSSLLPNRRRSGHWRAEASDTKTVREMTRLHAVQQWASPTFTGDVRVTVKVCFPTGRKRCDIDALAGLCKPVLDGLSGVVYADDRQIQEITYQMSRLDKSANGYYPDGVIVVTVTAASGE